MYKKRYEKLQSLMQEHGYDILALNPGPSLFYLTGLSFHLSERPVVLLVPAGSSPTLILPKLEKEKLSQSQIPLQGVFFEDNPETWQNAFNQASELLQLSHKRIGYEAVRLRALEFFLLMKSAPNADFLNAESIIATLRMKKDAEELNRMQKAVEIAQNALLATLPMIKPGKSEKEIASELTAQLLRHGSDPEFPFYPIVSGGPNSANPHATPTERTLRTGDLLVIDWGASFEGYVADLTRTFAIGKIDSELQKIAEVVLRANEEGKRVAHSQIPIGEVDKATRKIITDAGYGEFFTHRTGHGLGLEGHEPPYIFSENNLLIEEGMTFTIEPGIYLPGKGGVRIEDDVVITQEGCYSLSNLSRELVML
ncbi:M24 family metallopeptidase [Anaerolinea thermophila]|uniref:M24B family peptidase n=1 Tax=Anaerolinea thermophila (strain DSM 14523 / JCM 11388 / NBRC 100420 / UNI-1) TaxID=926569 RepID=E8N5B9_ANATU|nr:Xaa-Pro peptidase family protein [Anaerolinea thermophila]BAJ63633.1 putative M24B family peptidase [Anaerolinea thermophila UNI-1]